MASDEATTEFYLMLMGQLKIRKNIAITNDYLIDIFIFIIEVEFQEIVLTII